MTVSKLLLTAALTQLPQLSLAANNDPVVLVHGLGGWSEDEFGGASYWPYRNEFADVGLTPIQTSVGKFTSNWHRACELYAQLKGLRTDYGVCHAREFGHNRFGKDFTGQAKLPEWGVSTKAHFVGHSMGGQTMRMLEILLHEGSGCAEDESELFQGGKDWISSISSISGTLSGTVFVDLIGDEWTNVLRDIIIALAGLLDTTLLEGFYDIDFSQWGLERAEGESFSDFWARAQAAGIIDGTNPDISSYDLSTKGAKELNDRGLQAYPNTYYFSFATERTNLDIDCAFLFFGCVENQLPSVLMTPFLWLTSTIIGQNAEEGFRKNDGLVDWQGQKCPTSNTYGQESCVEYDGSWTPGQWHWMDVPYLDHLQVIGEATLTDIFNYDESPLRLYREHAARLSALPSSLPDDASALAGLSSVVVANEQSDLPEEFASIQYLAVRPAESESGYNSAEMAFISIMSILGFVALVAASVFVVKRRNVERLGDVTVTVEAPVTMPNLEKRENETSL